MNSDFEPFTQLWRQQPTPPPRRSSAEVLHAVRETERRWNAEWDVADRGYWWLFGLSLFTVATDLVRGHGVDWPGALLGAIWGWWLLLAFWFRRQRRRLERAGDVPLTDQFAKLRTLIAYRQRTNRLQLLALPLLSIAIGAMAWSIFEQRAAAMVAGAASVLLLWWLIRFQQRKIELHFTERAQSIAQMSREIENSP